MRIDSSQESPLAQHLIRNPFSVENLRPNEFVDSIIYRAVSSSMVGCKGGFAAIHPLDNDEVRES
jgi:hypothetical protein